MTKRYHISPIPTKDPENNDYRVWEGIEKRYMGTLEECREWIDDKVTGWEKLKLFTIPDVSIQNRYANAIYNNLKIGIMTEATLREKIRLVLKDFDNEPNADMKKFIDHIMDYNSIYIFMQMRNNKKKIIVEYLESALANER